MRRAVAPALTRTQIANVVAYHALVSLVNLLNLPLPRGTFVSHRGWRVTVLERDVRRLRMLKDEIALADPASARGYLQAVRALHFETSFLLHQEPDLRRNAVFFEDFDRLGTLLAHASAVTDAEDVRRLAFKLTIMLPFFEDDEAMRERNARADAWYREAEAGAR